MSGRPRQQPGSACEECRRKKLRCDRRRPTCGHCADSAVVCEVSPHRLSRGPKKGSIKALQSRIVALESQLSKQNKDINENNDNHDSNDNSNNDNDDILGALDFDYSRSEISLNQWDSDDETEDQPAGPRVSAPPFPHLPISIPVSAPLPAPAPGPYAASTSIATSASGTTSTAAPATTQLSTSGPSEIPFSSTTSSAQDPFYGMLFSGGGGPSSCSTTTAPPPPQLQKDLPIMSTLSPLMRSDL